MTTAGHDLRAVRLLDGLTRDDVAIAGGKGASLGELTAAGLPVPAGFVVAAKVFDEVVRKQGNDPVELAAASLLDETAREVLAAYRDLPGGPDLLVAVRSSAVDEDGGAASFAGINDTVLGVRGEAGLLDAVRHCWASAFSPRALAYRGERAPDGGPASMAVVVQVQVEASRAGVAFTADPITGEATAVVIEAARGLGEAVVSGTLTPDRIVVDKRSRRVVGREAHGGDANLTSAEAVAVADLALEAERHYGGPQDVEWALDVDGRAWILQARPVTTIAVATGVRRDLYDTPRSPGSRWTRANIAEALPGVPTPLTWSLWQPVLEEAYWAVQIAFGVAARREDRSAPVMTLALGRPAISVDLALTHVARLPGADPDAFAEQIFGLSRGSGPAPPSGRARALARIIVNAPWALATVRGRLARANAASTLRWEATVWGPPAVAPIVLLEETLTRFAQTMTVHTLQTYICQGLYERVEKVAGEEAPSLVSADGELAEARLAEDLWAVAHSQLTEAEFLRRHGFHGPDEGELSARSWREDPAPLRATLDALRAAADDRAPAIAAQRRSRRRAEATRRASLPALRRKPVRALIRAAGRAVAAREVGKSAFLRDLDVARYAARLLGDDAVWHTLDELRAATVVPVSEIARRSRRRAELAGLELPVGWVGDPEPVDRAGEVDGHSMTVVRGLAASPGRARGRARVVTDASALSRPLEPDEILVAHITDPSWVIHFMTAGAMVIDVGGALSHGAIVARELGVPCVIGTGDGTQRIPDGALVEVDGDRGEVAILEAETSLTA